MEKTIFILLLSFVTLLMNAQTPTYLRVIKSNLDYDGTGTVNVTLSGDGTNYALSFNEIGWNLNKAYYYVFSSNDFNYNYEMLKSFFIKKMGFDSKNQLNIAKPGGCSMYNTIGYSKLGGIYIAINDWESIFSYNDSEITVYLFLTLNQINYLFSKQ